eukprot:2906041-Pyramimonas_sp.AAC.2
MAQQARGRPLRSHADCRRRSSCVQRPCQQRQVPRGVAIPSSCPSQTLPGYGGRGFVESSAESVGAARALGRGGPGLQAYAPWPSRPSSRGAG